MVECYEEIETLKRNDTWTLVPPKSSQSLVGKKWVFKVKHNADRSFQRCKARLVAEGCTPTLEVDYSETFSPIVKASTIRVVLAIVVAWGVKRNNKGMHLTQTRYIEQLLRKTKMEKAKPCITPAAVGKKLCTNEGEALQNPTEYRRMIGALQYLTNTMPSISFIVYKLTQYMQKPTTDQLQGFGHQNFVKVTYHNSRAFGSVCKFWFTLLSDPKFIYKKLFFYGENDFNDNSHHPVIVKRKDNSNLKSVFSLFSCDTFEMSTPQEIPCPKDIMENISDLSIVGYPTSDGFICLRDVYDPEKILIWKEEYDTDCNMFLWNPLTSEIKIIPRCNTPNVNSCALRLVEFGFDRKNNDYKIFKMCLVYYNDKQCVPNKMIVIFSLKNGSWREVDVAVPDIHTSLDGKCHYTGANGIFHWWDLWVDDDDENGQNQIVSFDLSNEIFKTAPLPDGLISIDYKVWPFFCLSDCVGTLGFSDFPSFISIEVWIMFEYGVKESWTKLFSISSLSPLQRVERALGFGRNGEIFMATWGGQLLLWNPITEAITEFQIGGYKKSLQIVTLNGEPGSIN